MGKGGKRNRLAVHSGLTAAGKEYLAAAGHDHDSYLLLPVRNVLASSDPDQKLSRGGVNYLFRKYFRILCIEGRTVHLAWATFITPALENKCPIEHTQRSVGHVQLKIIQVYDKRVVRTLDSEGFAVWY